MKKIGLFGALALISVACLPLAGCAHHKGAVLTSAQRHQVVVRQLEQAGVQVIVLGESVRLVIPSDRLFVSGSANANKSYEHILALVTHYMKSYRTVDIQVVGYTDNHRVSGTPENYQDALTAGQARQVIDSLWQRGVNTRLLYAVGGGWRNAVAWNGGAESSKQNRRVEISFRFYPQYNSWE